MLIRNTVIGWVWWLVNGSSSLSSLYSSSSSLNLYNLYSRRRTRLVAGLGVLKSRNFDRSYLGTGGGDGSYANRLWVRVGFEGQGSTRVICHLGFQAAMHCKLFAGWCYQLLVVHGVQGFRRAGESIVWKAGSLKLIWRPASRAANAGYGRSG